MHDAPGNNNSPARKEIKEAINDTELKKSNSNDRLDANPKENIDESWERKEAEKRDREWREEIERREQEYKQAQ